MKVLLHICCAACFIGAGKSLDGEGLEVEGLFYNPNIHPLLEFRKRIKAMKVLLENVRTPVTIDESYGLDLFMREVYRPEPGIRCVRCYELRLRRTADVAREQGADAFTTTLLISPHQMHDTIRRVGERIGEESGVPFLYRDFRALDRKAHDDAKRRHLYLQQYCGCCFSEYERYRDTTRELYKPDIARRPSEEDTA